MYLSPVIHVAFIAQDHLLHVGRGMLFDVPDPVLDVVEGLFVGDVVDQHDAHGAPVIRCRNRSKSLLTRRVPDL